MFLTPRELRELTGKAQKAKQVEQLRRMAVPHYLNASGHPVVARAVIEGGRKEHPAAHQPWRPAVLGT
jgi:hypothetical protein